MSETRPPLASPLRAQVEATYARHTDDLVAHERFRVLLAAEIEQPLVQLVLPAKPFVLCGINTHPGGASPIISASSRHGKQGGVDRTRKACGVAGTREARAW